MTDLNRPLLKDNAPNPFTQLLNAVKEVRYSDSITVAAGCDFYIAQRLKPQSAHPSTIKSWESLRDEWTRVFPGLKVNDLTPRHILQMYEEFYKGIPNYIRKTVQNEDGTTTRLPNSIRHVRKRHEMLLGMLQFLVGLELCDPNVLVSIKLTPYPHQLVRESLKPNRTKRYTSEEDMENVLSYCKDPNIVAICRIVFLSGARTVMIGGLHEADITILDDDFWYYDPTYHKTSRFGHRRIIPFGPRCIQLLTEGLSRKHLSPGPIFRTTFGTPYTVDWLSTKLRKLCKKAGRPLFTMSDLRRTRSQLYRVQYNKDIESLMMGHSQDVAEKYYNKENLQLMMEVAKEVL